MARRVVDRFKLRLRDALEQTIKKTGGVSHAIIREAFLDWDADASGKLDPHELVRVAMKTVYCWLGVPGLGGGVLGGVDDVVRERQDRRRKNGQAQNLLFTRSMV